MLLWKLKYFLPAAKPAVANFLVVSFKKNTKLTTLVNIAFFGLRSQNSEVRSDIKIQLSDLNCICSRVSRASKCYYCELEMNIFWVF